MHASYYCYNFQNSITLKTTNRVWTDHLHKGIFLFSNPRVMYLGMQDQYFTFTMFDAQAWYARDYIMGKITIPSAEAMRQEFASWRAREEKLNSEEDSIRFQADYIDDLVKSTDYPMLDVQKCVLLLIDWVIYISQSTKAKCITCLMGCRFYRV